jgi:hypothetical protein
MGFIAIVPAAVTACLWWHHLPSCAILQSLHLILVPQGQLPWWGWSDQQWDTEQSFTCLLVPNCGNSTTYQSQRDKYNSMDSRLYTIYENKLLLVWSE